MIKWMRGNKIIRTYSISNGVSYSLDTEISPPHPESWRKRVLNETFSEDNGTDAGM